MKNNTLKIIIALVFPILFNTWFFMRCGTAEYGNASWVSFGFVNLAFICLLATAVGNKPARGLTVTAVSLNAIALVYFLAQLVLGVVWIYANTADPVWPVMSQSVLLGIFIIALLMSLLANRTTSHSIARQKSENLNTQLLADQIKSALHAVKDADLRKEVERCYDALNNCPVESYPDAQAAEQAMSDAVSALCRAIRDANAAEISHKAAAVIAAVRERNTLIKRCRLS